MMFNIVLMEPEIPTNTGNIGRLSLASGSKLHLVKPFGFEINDSRLKRAGLDYWKHLDPIIYDSVEAFFEQHKGKKMVFLSSHGTQDYGSIDYEDGLFLIFGKESSGLDEAMLNANREKVYKIPLFSEHIRSLNLSNAVSIVVYDGIQKTMKQELNAID